MLGGMWGFHSSKDRKFADQFYIDITTKINKATNNDLIRNEIDKDQRFLSKYIYPKLKKISLIHDSYFCQVHKDSVAFPTQREGDCFVGAPYTSLNQCVFKRSDLFKCPVDCRPIEHKDWINC